MRFSDQAVRRNKVQLLYYIKWVQIFWDALVIPNSFRAINKQNSYLNISYSLFLKHSMWWFSTYVGKWCYHILRLHDFCFCSWKTFFYEIWSFGATCFHWLRLVPGSQTGPELVQVFVFSQAGDMGRTRRTPHRAVWTQNLIAAPATVPPCRPSVLLLVYYLLLILIILLLMYYFFYCTHYANVK